MRRAALLVFPLFALACSPRPPTPEAGKLLDGGNLPDAGLGDAGAADGGADGGPDAGPDAGIDAGTALDAGDFDAGTDAGATADAGVADAGPDAGAFADAGGLDAGSDAGAPADAGSSCAPLDGGDAGCAGSACAWATANPGDVVSLGGLDPASLPQAPLAVVPAAGAGVLVFSDSPETFPSSGVLYTDTVGPGPVRLFVYHVSGAASAKKVSVVLENDDPSNAVNVTVTASGLAGPSSKYLYCGKVAVLRWLQSAAGSAITVPAGQAALLDPALDGLSIASGELVNGIYDVTLDGPLTVYVVALDATTDTLSAYASLSVLAEDQHQRGTFWPDALVASGDPGCPLDTAWGALDAPLPTSYAVQGTDATSGASLVLGGQYGVTTELDLPVASSDGRRVALLLDPRGGDYGGAATVPAGLTSGGVVELPSAATSVVDQGILAGRFDPASQPLAGPLIWTLPGGSSAPVDLLLLPY